MDEAFGAPPGIDMSQGHILSLVRGLERITLAGMPQKPLCRRSIAVLGAVPGLQTVISVQVTDLL